MSVVPPPPGAPGAAPPALSAELCREAATALREHNSVLKLYGCPIAVVDLERMAQGGSQDRKEDLARLTSNQLSDVNTFARLLRGMIDGIKAGKHPKGQAIEVGRVSTPSTKAQTAVGALARSGPALATGLKAGAVGAAMRQSGALGPDKVFTELLTKALSSIKLEAGGTVPTTLFVAQVVPLEKVLAKLDAVMVQRLCRDVLRTSPASRGLGMDALRFLSPLADAMESVVAERALMHAYAAMRELTPTVCATAESHKAALTPAMKGRDVLAEVTALRAAPAEGPMPCDRNHATALALGDRVAHAAAALVGLELNGLLGQVHRRVAFDTTQGPAALALAAFIRLVDAIAAAKLPLPASLAASAGATLPVAAPGKARAEWPALKPEEVVLLADHVFNPQPESFKLLPAANAAPQRSPGRLLLTLRAEQALIPEWLTMLDAGQRAAAPTTAEARYQLKVASTFFAGLDAAAREEIVRGLYQMGTGDPEQRGRQVGRYLTLESEAVLKAGATLGPVRVAFAKFWRKVEGV